MTPDCLKLSMIAALWEDRRCQRSGFCPSQEFDALIDDMVGQACGPGFSFQAVRITIEVATLGAIVGLLFPCLPRHIARLVRLGIVNPAKG